MKPISSVISGLPNLERQEPNSIGLQHGGAGCVDLHKARERLLAQSPEETDRNLVQWFKSCLMVEPREEVTLTYPVGGGYKRNVTGYSFPGLTDENRFEAQRAIRGAMTPATPDQCEEWITTLYAMTARRSDDEVSQAVILRFYSQTLGRFPADVAQSVWNYFLRRKEKPNFFPTLSELEDACERASKSRVAMLNAVG